MALLLAVAVGTRAQTQSTEKPPAPPVESRLIGHWVLDRAATLANVPPGADERDRSTIEMACGLMTGATVEIYADGRGIFFPVREPSLDSFRAERENDDTFKVTVSSTDRRPEREFKLRLVDETHIAFSAAASEPELVFVRHFDPKLVISGEWKRDATTNVPEAFLRIDETGQFTLTSSGRMTDGMVEMCAGDEKAFPKRIAELVTSGEDGQRIDVFQHENGTIRIGSMEAEPLSRVSVPKVTTAAWAIGEWQFDHEALKKLVTDEARRQKILDKVEKTDVLRNFRVTASSWGEMFDPYTTRPLGGGKFVLSSDDEDRFIFEVPSKDTLIVYGSSGSLFPFKRVSRIHKQ